MGRPRKGPQLLPDGRCRAVLPVVTGDKRTRTFTDPDEAAVRRWFADGERALAAGEPLPDPAGYRRQQALAVPVAGALVGQAPRDWWAGPTPDHGHRLDEVAAAFVRFRYETLDQAQGERKAAVRTDAEEIVRYFARRNATTVEQLNNDLVAGFARHLAGRPAAPAVTAPLWPQIDGRREITLGEAGKLQGLSRSTVKRLRKQLPSWHVDPADGRVRISVEELRAAAGERAERQASRRALAQTTAGNKLGLLRMILDYARARGIALTGDPMGGVVTVAPGGTESKPAKKVVPLAEIARAGAFMAPIHQLAMWLERIEGVRISEGFGPLVEDFLDFGDVYGACLLLDRQGGRPFRQVVDGVEVLLSAKDRLKTPESHREILLPRQMTELIRVVIEVYHTDPVTGAVDGGARLIPWLYKEGSGQGAHRTALDDAVAAAEIDLEVYGRITPHHLRASAIEDMRQAGVPDKLARRYVGHLAGEDVHDRHYALDPARTPEELQRWRPVTDALEKLIDEQVGLTLMVPTTHRNKFSEDNPLRGRSEHIHAALVARGWLLEPSTADGQDLLSAAQVARALGIADKTARRQLRENVIPGGVLVSKEGRSVWMCPPDALEEHQAWLAAHPTIEEVAAELGQSYHQVYALVTQLCLPVQQKVERGDLRLTPEAVTQLRVRHRSRRELAARAVPLSTAAVELDVPVGMVETLLRRGVLELDAEATSPRQRWITRSSLAAYRSLRVQSAQIRPRTDEVVLPDRDARAVTGLTRPALSSLVISGVLVSTSRNRRRHITAASIQAWAVGAGLVDVQRRLATWTSANAPVDPS